MKDEILINAQTAVFFQQTIAQPEKIWADLCDKFGDIFDQPPLILPIPNQAQAQEIPIVQVSSSNGVYKINISRKRADFYFAGEGDQKFTEKQDLFIKHSLIIFDYFSTITKISRMAIIIRNFIEDSKPEETISTKLFSSNFTKLFKGEVYDSFIRYTTRIDFDGFRVNDYITLEKSGMRIVGINDNATGILITRDINTANEIDFSDKINTTTFNSFVKNASTRANQLEDIKKILCENNPA